MAASEIMREVGKHLQTVFTTSVSLVHSYHPQIYPGCALKFTLLNEYNSKLHEQCKMSPVPTIKLNWNFLPSWKSYSSQKNHLEAINCQIMHKSNNRFILIDKCKNSQGGLTLNYFVGTLMEVMSLRWQVWCWAKWRCFQSRALQVPL